ncbi:MAG: flavin reductase family protein [Ornithinimicrobium sp.]
MSEPRRSRGEDRDSHLISSGNKSSGNNSGDNNSSDNNSSDNNSSVNTPVEAMDFRRAIGRLASGVVVATTFAGQHDHAMTATAVISVSLEPVLVLISVDKEARWHDAVMESKIWGLSVMPQSLRSAAQWFSTPGRPLHGQLDRVPHHRGALGVALIDGALATLECRTYATHSAGDHTLVIGEVVAVATPPDLGPALVHFRGTFGSLQ